MTDRPHEPPDPDEEDRVYERIIRDSTQSYLRDGTPARCPRCGSEQVETGEEWYEFTMMRCAACAHEQLTDDWQLADWYPPKE